MPLEDDFLPPPPPKKVGENNIDSELLLPPPPKKKEPTIGLGYEKPSEALRMGGLPKQEKLAQSPLKTAEITTPSVSTKSALEGIKGTSTPPTGVTKIKEDVLPSDGMPPDIQKPQPRLSAEEQQTSELAATKGYEGQETEGTQLDIILANQKTQNIPLEQQMTSKEMTEQLDLLMPSTQGVEANQAFEAIFKKEGREVELDGVNETQFKKFLSATGIADKYNKARMEYDLSDKERYAVIQKFNQSIAGKSVQDLKIVKARLNLNPAYQEYQALKEQAQAVQEQWGSMGIDEVNIKFKSPEEIAQYNELLSQENALNEQADAIARESGITKDLQDFSTFNYQYAMSLLRSRLLIDNFPNILKEKQLQDKADAEYEDRRARFKKGDLSVLPTSAMYVGASAVNALNRNFYNSLASLIDNFGKLNDNTYSLGDWASKGLTELADNAIITPHKEFSKSGYNIDGYIVTKDKSGAISVFDKDFTPVQVDPNLAKKFNEEYDKKESTGAEKETMYDFFSLAPQLADQFVTMYSLVGGGRLAQVGLQSLTTKAISKNTGMTAASYLMTYEDYKKTGIENGLSDTDAHLFASISAMTTSLLEGISPNENLIPKSQVAKALEAFTASVGAPIKTRMKAVANALVVEPTKEIIQEITQIGGDILTETGANAVLGKDVFDAATDMDEIRNTAMLTYGTTALAQLPTAGLFDTKNKKEWWQWASKDVDKLMEQVQEDVKNGLYTEEKAQIIVEKAKAWAATQGKIPAGTEDVKRAQITPLLMEKVELLETSKDLDKVFQDKINKRIDAIDKEIVGIMNKPVSEFTTEVKETTTEETDGEGTIEGAISTGTDVAQEGLGVANEPSSEGITGEGVQAEAVPQASLEEQKADIEKRRQEELKDYANNRASTLFKFNPDGNNEELTEDEIELAEKIVQKGIEKNWSSDKIAKALQSQGFVRNVAINQKALLNYLNNRLLGKTNSPINGKLLTDTNAKYDAELAALDKQKVPEVVSEKVTEVTAPAIEVTPTAEKTVTAPKVSEALKDVESTAKALKELPKDSITQSIDGIPLPQLEINGYKRKPSEQYKINDAKSISEAYHKAKADGSNPELVKAVEKLLGKPTAEAKTTTKPVAERIADLRAKEQAEYDAMANSKDKAKRKEIYDKYDKLITPLIAEQKAAEEKTSLSDKNKNIISQDEKQKLSQSTGDGRGRTGSGEITPLEGAPTIQGATGPNPQLVAVAEQYAKDNGIDLKRQGEYVEVDEDRAKRIADAYEQMANEPQNPKVKEAYQNLIKQTKAQYEALVKAGYKFWFLDLNIPSNQNYAESPYNAMRDLRSNKEMGVFPTTDGFGTGDINTENNPLLEDTGIKWPVGGLDGKTKPVLANDLFRAVHDAFGHGLEGAGFRARGEENAWQAHSRLYTGSALGAITTETRGQNSWVNFGPKGEANRKASAEETVFADQKIGLMPEFTWIEGRASDMPTAKEPAKPKAKKSKPEQIGEGLLDLLGLAPVEPTEGEVKFSKTTGEPQILTPTVEKEQEVIDQMNKMNLVNEGIDLVAPSTTTEEIDVDELNSRLDNPLETVKWTDYEGVPFTFTISDQLRAGDAVNPNTGQTITDLKGGIGFNGTKGNENNAWANTTKEEAEAMLQRAKDVYSNNKPLFDKLWKEGKLPDGHIPMAVVKMAETSILSNEAVFRVGIQNIETLPKANRKKAVVELAKSMQSKIDTESASLKRGVDKNGKPYTKNTINVKKKSINQYQRILDLIKKNKYDDIVDLGNDIDKFSLPEKTIIAKEIFYGDPNPAGTISKKPGEPKTPVSMALVEGLDTSKRELINIGVITDLLTEPSMKDVPNVHVISIVGVDVRATEVNKINHPNYPYGVKGVSIGVLKNPVHMKDAFGEAYGSALGQIVKNEANNASISMKNVFSQGIPVQSGLPNRVFKSAIAQGALDSVDKLAGFLRQAFPNTTFFTSNEAWDAAMADPSIKKKLKDGDVVYAFTTDGNVFINPALKTTKATLHETGHIWMGFVKENNPALHAKGLDLVTGTKEHQKAIKEYGDTELAREEALMELMSSKGDTIVNASQKAKFKEWLLSVYKYIADNFTSLLGLSPKEVENLTLDKFLEGMLADVLSGKELTTKKIKGEVKFSRESQNDKIKDFIAAKKKAGESDKDIRAGLELVADKLNLTTEDINDLMGVESDEAKPLKGFKPKEKPAKETEGEKTGTRAFATKSVERAGVPIEDIPASLRSYRPTTVEEQQKIAEAFIRKHGINNTITELRLKDSGIDPKNKPVLASVLLKELYAEQSNTKDVAEIEKIAKDVHNVLDAVLTAATEAAQFMAMMREFYNSNPYNYVAQVTRLIEKNINDPIIASVGKAVGSINKANKDAAEKAASNVVKGTLTPKITTAKANFERSKANLKALWKKSFNIGIAANQYEAAKNDIQFAKALTIMAKDFVVYQSVQFSEFLKEVASQIGLKESDIDQDHLRKIFEKAKSEKIQAGIKVGLKELELKLKDLIESHYSATEIEGKLIDKLKDEFGVDSNFGLNDAAIKELETAIKREIKILTAKEKIKALKAAGIKEQKDVNEILSLSEEGLLNDNAILEALGDKLGIKKLTPEEAAKLADLAKDIKESKEDRIKARNIQKFEDYKFVLAKKYKVQDFLISNYLTNIFGSLTSNEKNIAGNVSETILLVGELVGNALASGNPKDIQRALKALVEGNIRGFDFTKEVLTTGVASYKEPGDIKARNMWELIMDRENDLTRTERILQRLFKIRYLGPTLLAERRFWNRALLSMDSLSGTTNNELGSLLAATREADTQKLRGAKRTKFIQEQMANSPEAQEEAREYAISAGYKPGTGKFNRAVANYLVSKRPEAIKKAAAEYSARATLTQRPPDSTMTGAIANGLNDLITKNPNIKFFVPVVNTFANLIVKNIERSPFEFFSLAFDAGRAVAEVESAKAGLTKAEVARRMKTATVWTGIAVLLFALAGGTGDDKEEGFEIFGSGTGDPVVDKTRRALGWKPNTVRFSKDGGYYNFEFLPFGFVLGMIGNMRDYFKFKKEPAFRLKQAKAKDIFGKNLDALTEDERAALDMELAIPGKYNLPEQERKEFANLSTQLALTPVNYSFQLLKSLGELVNAVGEGDAAINRVMKSITTIGRGIASPRYMGEVRDIFDNKLYDTKEFRNVLAANVPVVKLGNVLLDGFGREVEKYKSESMFSGIKYALTRGFYNPPTIKPLDQFLWENKIGIAPPAITPSMAYTEDFRRDYIVTRGKILMTNLTEALNNKEFEGLSPLEVLDVVNIYTTNANAEARDIIDEKLDKLK